MVSSRVIRFRTVLAALVIAGGLSAGGSGAVASNHSSGEGYLALGDSVVFGYITHDVPAWVNAGNFVGYPDYAGRSLHLDTVNASCPGETTTGFLDITGADNGCRPFRAAAQMHVAYTGTQMDFATGYLRHHPDTRLVTLGIGANDAFLLQKACATSTDPACVPKGLATLLPKIAANVHTILHALRATGYEGVLMLVNYYSLDYGDPVGTGFSIALNTALTAFAGADGAVVADVFTAFKMATDTVQAGKNTCKAGLLNGSPTDNTTCDVHPSQSGQQLIARTVERAFAAATGEGGDN